MSTAAVKATKCPIEGAFEAGTVAALSTALAGPPEGLACHWELGEIQFSLFLSFWLHHKETYTAKQRLSMTTLFLGSSYGFGRCCLDLQAVTEPDPQGGVAQAFPSLSQGKQSGIGKQ